MADRADSAWIRVLIGRTTTIVLATTDGDKPWVIPLGYMADDDLNFYYFSPGVSQVWFLLPRTWGNRLGLSW